MIITLICTTLAAFVPGAATAGPALATAPTRIAAGDPAADGATPDAKPNAMARAVVVDGRVEAQRDPGSGASGDDSVPWRIVTAGDWLEIGERVRTGDDGHVRLYLQNRSIVDLGSDSAIRLSYLDGPENNRRAGLRAIIGRLWARVASGAGGERFVVETDTAVAGVRGTSFFVEVEPELETRVTVSAGAVEVASPEAPPFLLGAAQRGIMRRGAAPVVQHDIAAAELSDLGRRTGAPARWRTGERRERLAKLAGRIAAHRGALGRGGALGDPGVRRLRALFRNPTLRRMLEIDPSLAERVRLLWRRRQ